MAPDLNLIMYLLIGLACLLAPIIGGVVAFVLVRTMNAESV